MTQSDSDAATTGEQEGDELAADAQATGRFSGVDVTGSTVTTALRWGGVLALGLLAVIAIFGLYSSLGSIIDVWIAHQYQPIARAGMNLAVLLIAVAGVLWLVRGE